VLQLLTALALRAEVLFAAVGDWHMPAFWVYPGLCSGLAVLFLPSIDRGLQAPKHVGRADGCAQGRGLNDRSESQAEHQLPRSGPSEDFPIPSWHRMPTRATIAEYQLSD
jgi:hypothetical protein